MTEQEALARMVAPGTQRPGKYRSGVIQIHVTRACDRACYGCTQGSNLGGKTGFMSPDQFRAAVESLRGYFGVVGVFGGNPALSPHFGEYCDILEASWVPKAQRGIWCNNPVTPARAMCMRRTFDPSVSNLNVHQDRAAYELFKKWWPESRPVGLDRDSRHSPVHLAMRDLDALPARPGRDAAWLTKVPNTEQARWDLIAECDINQHWSAMVGVFRGELRAWFCEVAGAQAMLHQTDPAYPDTGLPILENGDYVWAETRFWDKWWQLPMSAFGHQARKHCHECAVPLRGYGELANAPDDGGAEQTSPAHADVFHPKRPGRKVEVVTQLTQLGVGRLQKTTHYLQNAGR